MPHIAEESIRRVAEATDIVELIGSYFPLKRAGANWRALCPFHNEKTPSFNVNPARQTYRCFGCGAAGTVFRFLMEYEHIEFVEAVRRLAKRSGIVLIEEAGHSDDHRTQNLRRRLLALHAEASLWFHDNLMRSSACGEAREYLKTRGLGSATAKSWQIGYAPDDWQALPDLLASRGFSEHEILASGLVAQKEEHSRPYARFRGRIMFPVRNDYGEVIAFSGRLLAADAQAAKYVNSPETPLFTKGKVLFGLDKSKRALIDAKMAIVCEGQLDLISAFEAGVGNVIAPMGTAFTSEQARLLARFVESVTLCFDSDRAGQEATARSLPALLECGLQVKVVRLPDGHDPDSLIRAQGADAFRAVVEEAKDFFDHAIERTIESGALADPNRTSAASKKLGGFVAVIKDPVLRDAVSGRICARLGIEPKTFQAQLRLARTPRAQEAADSGDASPVVLELSPGVELLCRLAIHSDPCRAWLSAQEHPAEIGPGAELLAKILSSASAFSSPAEMAAFASVLPEPMERAFSSLNHEGFPEDPLAACVSAWNGMQANKISRRLEMVKAKLRQPGISSAETLDLQKQILDLLQQLNDLLRPAP